MQSGVTAVRAWDNDELRLVTKPGLSPGRGGKLCQCQPGPGEPHIMGKSPMVSMSLSLSEVWVMYGILSALDWGSPPSPRWVSV